MNLIKMHHSGGAGRTHPVAQCALWDSFDGKVQLDLPQQGLITFPHLKCIAVRPN